MTSTSILYLMGLCVIKNRASKGKCRGIDNSAIGCLTPKPLEALDGDSKVILVHVTPKPLEALDGDSKVILVHGKCVPGSTAPCRTGLSVNQLSL